MIRCFDAHNHAHDQRFGGCSIALVEEALKEGVAAMVVNGSSVDDWPSVAELARRFPEAVLPSFGVHPWYFHEQPADWERQLEDWLEEFPQAGVGEIGLDRWKKDLPWEGQIDVFLRQWRLAVRLNRTVSVHCLQAWGPLIALLQSEPRPARGFLLHSFGGSTESAKQLAALGAHFSIPGYFLHPHKRHKLAVFSAVPRDRLLIETDAPDQLPPPEFAPHTAPSAAGPALNHPANLPAIYRGVAAALEMPIEELAARAEANFRSLFGLPPGT